MTGVPKLIAVVKPLARLADLVTVTPTARPSINIEVGHGAGSYSLAIDLWGVRRQVDGYVSCRCRWACAARPPALTGYACDRQAHPNEYRWPNAAPYVRLFYGWRGSWLPVVRCRVVKFSWHGSAVSHLPPPALTGCAQSACPRIHGDPRIVDAISTPLVRNQRSCLVYNQNGQSFILYRTPGGGRQGGGGGEPR